MHVLFMGVTALDLNYTIFHRMRLFRIMNFFENVMANLIVTPIILFGNGYGNNNYSELILIFICNLF